MAGEEREPHRTRGRDPATRDVVTLLTSILTEVQTQVRSQTPKPLQGEAVTAVELFREIGATLALLPSITLTAEPAHFTVSDTSQPPFTSTLTWSSTEAQTVSIEGTADDDGSTVLPPTVVTPTAGGSLPPVSVSRTTTFTATAAPRGG